MGHILVKVNSTSNLEEIENIAMLYGAKMKLLTENDKQCQC